MTGGRHTWPDENTNAQGVNRDINGCAEIWAFFSRYDINGVTESATGIVSMESFQTLSFYPNPANESIKVNAEHDFSGTFEVYDMVGNRLISTQNTNIDLRELSSGMYFLVKKNKNGEKFSAKFLKL